MKSFGKPLIIEGQGSFAAGGTIIHEKGTYDESHALSPEGQEKHVDHGYVSSTVPDRAAPALKLRRTAGKDSRRSFFVKDTKCTSWISQGGGEQEAAEWKER